MSLLGQMTAPARAAEALDAVEGAQATEAERAFAEEIAGADATIEHLQESLADLQLALEDRGWLRLDMWARQQFTRDGIGRAADLGRAMWFANPLIRRGINLRSSYVWGGGATIQAKAAGGDDGQQDVNAVLQAFLDDKATRKTLTGATARKTNERTLGTDGNLFVALFTAPRTGRVQPRLIPLEEITEVVKNPEDRTEPWFYLRRSLNAQGVEVVTYHPDVDHHPARRITRINTGLFPEQTLPAGDVLWDAPVIHLKVNALPDWDFGVGDAFTALPFARMYQDFIADWAKLVKALSRFAWKATGERKGAAQKAAARIAQRQSATSPADYGPGASQAGQTVSMVGANLEAIPKTGATIDSESGKPVAALVAAALDVPVTMLLSDPGVTGARATAETLDTPTELMAGERREEWSGFFRSLCDYVIDAATLAPQGALSGVATRDEWGRLDVTLDGDTSRTVEVDWPDLSDTPVDILMQAIQAADDIDKLPPLLIVRLILAAFNVEDADEWLAQVTDEDGNFENPNPQPAGSAGVAAFQRGEDPAALLGAGDGNSGE